MKKVIGVATALLVAAGCTALGTRQFGQVPAGDDLARVSLSENHDGATFRNQNEIASVEEFSFWSTLRAWLFDRSTRAPENPIKVHKLALDNSAGTGTKVSWMGHSTMLVEMDGRRILLDPVFSNHASPFSWLPPKSFYAEMPATPESLGRVDAVVISHDHYDHLDHQSMLALKDRADRFIVPLGIGSHLRYWGIEPDRITELDWWQETQLGSITLTATPAHHFSGRGLTGGNETLWAGWAIKGRDHNVFFSGDTAYFPGFKEIGERLGPFDLTMIECGAYDASWSNVHMFPEQTAQAHKDLRGTLLMPVHWGRFDLAMHSWTEPMERLEEAAWEQNIALARPRIGESFTLGGPIPNIAWWLDEEETAPATEQAGMPLQPATVAQRN